MRRPTGTRHDLDAGAVLLATTGTADAATGRVNAAGSPLHVRAAPGMGYDAWSSAADGLVGDHPVLDARGHGDRYL